MKAKDKHYLLLQFKDRIHSKNGFEFQTFFEEIMKKTFPDFQKIRPCGNKGDGGNDGYIKISGAYYQVYAPNIPKTNDSRAAKKLNEDFQNLKDNWDEISRIKEYNFVFNDKYGGSTQLLEKTISDLKTKNPNIEFKLFLAHDLESLFFKLNESNILNLGFNIDHRDSLSIIYKFLNKVKVELDKEIAKYALKMLENSKDIISELNNENLSLEYELLECSCLNKLEKIDEVKEKYDNIAKRFPKDPRAFLYLAEIHLKNKDFNKNKELLEKAQEIDDNHWLLKLEELIRKSQLGEKIDSANIDEKTFPDDPILKANFYRLYALFLENSGCSTRADNFIEKAIQLNPNKLNSYIDRLSITENRLFSLQDTSQIFQNSQKFLEEIEEVENKFSEYGDIGFRNRAILNTKKLYALHTQENYLELEKISQKIFKLCIFCYFDKQIEQIFIRLLTLFLLPDNSLRDLLEYLKNSKKEISDNLSKTLIFQFSINDSLFAHGKDFFKEINNQKYLDFIKSLEDNNAEKILTFLKNDIELAIIIADTIKNSSIRREIIKSLPDDKNIQKEKLLLSLNIYEENFDEAYKIIKQMNLDNLNYFECELILKVIREKKAWDLEIVVLKKLLNKERDNKKIFKQNLQLFTALINLKKYLEAIELGEKLLKKDSVEHALDARDREILLSQTILANLERSKVDDDVLKKSKELLENHPLTQPSFEFKIHIESEVYLNNNESENALKSVIEGVKTKKILSATEYAELFLTLSIKIANKINLKPDSLDTIKENTFIKFKNNESWYFIGDDNELDAIKILRVNNKYQFFINKKQGEKVTILDEYSSKNIEGIIEYIFTIERYILWKAIHYFQELSQNNDLDGVQSIEVPQKDESINIEYLLKFLEDTSKNLKPFFEIYCKNNIPLAVLSVFAGGLENAIGHICNENRGFIHFCTGKLEEFKRQKEVAKNIINKKLPFYIDGTSALILSEIGLF